MQNRPDNQPQRSIGERVLRSRAMAWTILNIFTPIDNVLLKASTGRYSILQSVIPNLLLTTIGAKSGLPRAVPLVFMRDGERIVLIASNGGEPKHPAWYHNIKANPQVTAAYAGEIKSYLANEVEGAERERLWQKAVQLASNYDAYESRTQGRVIPVIVLTPG